MFYHRKYKESELCTVADNDLIVTQSMNTFLLST